MQLAYGFAVSRRLPQEARSAFGKVLERQPRNPRALYGLGMLSAAQARSSQEALTLFTLAIEVDPSFVEARRGRANVLAQRRNGNSARGNRLVRQDGSERGHALRRRLRLRLDGGQVRQSRGRRWSGECAVELLAAALERGYGREIFTGDEDFGGPARSSEVA